MSFGNLNSLGSLGTLGVTGTSGRLQPAELFGTGAEGIYLPSLRDAVTAGNVYQDSAGTTPVTGVEEPVGKIAEGSPNMNALIQPTDADRPILSARVNKLEETATLSTQSITTVAGDYVVSFSGNGSITFSGTNTDTVTEGSTTITCTTGTLTATVTGEVTNADLRPADQATGLLPDYQRVGDVNSDPTDYDWENFPWHLAFNGVNTLMYVPNMTPNSDEVFIVVGVRKESDDATGMVLEYTNGLIEGAFSLLAPSSNGVNSYKTYSVGDGYVQDAGDGNFAEAPDTAVLTCKAKISEQMVSIKHSNGYSDSSGASQGSGNYLNNKNLHIGSRAGVLFFFNGNIYSLILAFKIPGDRVINKAEHLANKNTKAY